MSEFEPAYIKSHESGKLEEAAGRLAAVYDQCTLCARNCEADRNNGETGVCKAGSRVKISSAHAHFGEERPLVGRRGSGTIFLAHCNLLCLYCQNWDISHHGGGDEIDDEELSSVMLRLQESGCHNINFVSPTHYLPNIIRALVFAVEKGLRVPIVYNTGTYERLETIQMLDGIVDIYLPDFKYADGETAEKYSPGAGDYPEVAKAALKEMHRQVGVLKTDKNNIALRGLMIRHLVLPNGLAGTEEFVKFVAEELDRGTYVNIMDQYHPTYKANRFPELARATTNTEYSHALLMARKYGLHNLD